MKEAAKLPNGEAVCSVFKSVCRLAFFLLQNKKVSFLHKKSKKITQNRIVTGNKIIQTGREVFPFRLNYDKIETNVKVTKSFVK